MREILYGLAFLLLLYVLVLQTYFSEVLLKEEWAETQPKVTLGYLVDLHVTGDAGSICGDVTTLELDTGTKIRICGTFPIVKVGAAVEAPTTKYDAPTESFADKLVFCVGDICRLEAP